MENRIQKYSSYLFCVSHNCGFWDKIRMRFTLWLANSISSKRFLIYSAVNNWQPKRENIILDLEKFSHELKHLENYISTGISNTAIIISISSILISFMALHSSSTEGWLIYVLICLIIILSICLLIIPMYLSGYRYFIGVVLDKLEKSKKQVQ